MYSDETFLVKDPTLIRAFVEQHPFAMLVANDAEGRPVATHLPLLVEAWDERIVLRGHLMRDSDHGRVIDTGTKVFVCFHGPQAPVLGSWQMTRRFGGTWNYQAVHVRGVVEARDHQTLLAHLETLKNRFETSPEHRFDSLPRDYIDALTPVIRCIDIVVTDFQCLFKLSQNRRIEEFDRTTLELERQGGQPALVAAAMRSLRGRFFAGA
jgi:transcriptional regulator